MANQAALEKFKSIPISPDDVSNSGISLMREQARAKLALKLLSWTGSCILASIAIGGVLIWLLPDKIDFKDLVSLVQAIGTLFSGLLGAAIAFYFSAKD